MGEEFLVKVHESYRWVVAICDRGLFGNKFVEGKKVLDLTGKFFEGDVCGLEEVREKISDLVREDATFNIIGKNSVKVALELGIVKKEGIMKIDGVPFALVLL